MKKVVSVGLAAVCVLMVSMTAWADPVMDQALGRKVKLFDWELVGFGRMMNKLIKRYS